MTVLTADQVAQLAVNLGLQGETAAIAVAISRVESSFTTDIVGPTHTDSGRPLPSWTDGGAIGLWQILPSRADRGTGRTRDRERLTDPNFNGRSMMTLSAGGRDWTPWTAYNSGAYRNVLPAARTAVNGKHATDGFEIPFVPDFVEDPIHAVGGGVIDAATSTADALGAIGSVLGKLTDAGFWRRIGIGIAGSLLLLLGVVIVFKDTSVGQAVAGAAGSLGTKFKGATSGIPV